MLSYKSGSAATFAMRTLRKRKNPFIRLEKMSLFDSLTRRQYRWDCGIIR